MKPRQKTEVEYSIDVGRSCIKIQTQPYPNSTVLATPRWYTARFSQSGSGESGIWNRNTKPLKKPLVRTIFTQTLIAT